jgi:hypothetical protein
MKKLAVLLVVLAVAAGAIVAITASGSDASKAEDPVYGVGQVRATSVAALAQCSDWNEGTEAEKQATIDDIYNQMNQANSGGPTPDLPDDEAYALFERSCAPSYAAGFRLYKLFIRAGAFENLLGQ